MRLLDPSLVEHPYPEYARWRSDQPVWWAEDVQGWVLSRHDDVRAVLKQSEAFSSAAMGGQVPLPLLCDDPPRHTQLRKLVDRAFTTRRLRDLEAEVDLLARDLVDAIPAGEPVDIVRALTQPLPVAVIARMMGIPVERAADFKRRLPDVFRIVFDPARLWKELSKLLLSDRKNRAILSKQYRPGTCGPLIKRKNAGRHVGIFHKSYG